jgi:septum site-determining protein MinC
MSTALTIKGIRDGLLISVTPARPPAIMGYEKLLQLLTEELAAKKEFLRGSRIALALADRLLDQEQLTQLQNLMSENGMELWAVLADTAATREAARELGLATRLPGSNTDLDGNALIDGRDGEGLSAAGHESHGSNGLLLKETVRSGRHIFHEGHLIIVGDVNPGAQLVAGGDVIVWGKLRGLVHAGALGNTTAVICALELIPTQLRIADQIAISPEERRLRPLPEMAAIRDGRIVAETWPLGDKQR